MHSPSGSHGRNLAIMVTAEAVQKVFTLALFVLVSRALSVEENGRYALFITMVPFMTVWINMGMYDVAVRDIAREPSAAGRFAGSAWLPQAVLCAVTLALMPLLSLHAGTALLVIGPCVGLAATLGRMCFAPFAAAGCFGPLSLTLIFLRAFTLALSALALWTGGGALGLAIALLAAHLLWMLFGAVWARRDFALRWRMPDRPTVRHLLLHGAPIAAGGLFATLFFSMDLPLLAVHATPEDMGYYSIGARFLWMLFPLVEILGSVIYPVLSRKTGGRDEGFALGRVFRAAWLLGLPLAVGGMVLARPITVLLAGGKFLPGAYAVGGLTAVLGLFLLSSVATVHLRAQGRQMVATVVMAAACAAKALVMLAADGQGMALVAANLGIGAAIAVLLCISAARRMTDFSWREAAGALLRAAAAAVVMGLALWPLREFTPFLGIPVGAGVYLAAVLALGAVDAWDRALVRAAWRRPGSERTNVNR